MDNNVHASFKAFDRSYLAILKKDIHALGIAAGFSEVKCGELDIIVAELSGNLVKHADNGIILAKRIKDDGLAGVEIISIDEGPGMSDVNRMMGDGMSTKNTLGQGLGAIKRLSDFFQVYSQKDWGTIMVIRLYAEKPRQQHKPLFVTTRQIIVPKPGERECGDGFFWKRAEHTVQFFLGDGLGHGSGAAEAVKKAGDAFLTCEETDPAAIIRYINQFTKNTRELVGTVAVLDSNEQKWYICGVGNIMSKIISQATSKTHIPYNGIIGLNVPNTMNPMEINYERDQYLIMCSDGIRSRWDLSKYPGLFRYDLSVMTACIFKDYNQNNDDMSVAACKINL